MNKYSNASSALAKGCLAFEERPPTPPEFAKFRRSKTLEPGRRFIHPGIADDMERLHLDSKVFGRKNGSLGTTAAALIHAEPLNVVQRLNATKAENVYHTLKREPLGSSYRRDYSIPERFTNGDDAFGKSTRNDEPAKTIIFPEMTEASFAGEELYKRSHGVHAVGEQLRRGYDWGQVNPEEFRFGVKGETIAYNGVSRNVALALTDPASADSRIGTKKVEEQRNAGDQLGRARDLGQGSSDRSEQFVYGLPSAYSRRVKSQWGALETIRGKYAETRPGEDRVFGCPTVRRDIPLPSRRSVADPQNYGDEVPGKDLIHPRVLAGSAAVEEPELHEPRPKGKVRALFRSIGYALDDEDFERVYRAAAGDADCVSVSAFRDALNEYLE